MSKCHLSRRDFLQVRELLAENLPSAEIAQRLQLTPEMVAEIAAGRAKPSRIVVDPDDPNAEAALTAQRCPGCGALVYVWPCLACQMANRTPARAVQSRVGGLRLKDKLRREARRRAA